MPIGRDPQSGLWEFWHAQSGEEPQRAAATGELVLGEESGLVFVLIPGGSFWMGAQHEDPSGQNYDPQAEANEIPLREVTLDPFFFSKYEMTQAQWLRFTGANPSIYVPGEADVRSLLHPVENVSWEDCDLVLRRLGLSFPTEAQWEYAARAGTSTAWWTGAEVESLAGAANLADRTSGARVRREYMFEAWLADGHDVHAPVGRLQANGFGLHDVHGNVLEWCRDWYSAEAHELHAGDGERSVPHGTGERANRGGSWFNLAVGARAAKRDWYKPADRMGGLGLRPATAV